MMQERDELVRCAKCAEEIFDLKDKDVGNCGVGNFEMGSVQEQVREPTLVEEKVEIVLKKEPFEDGVTSDRLLGKEKPVAGMDAVDLRIGSEKEDTDVEEENRNLAKTVEETNQFYADLSRIDNRVVMCALCNWILKKGSPNWKRNITTHVAIHLGTKVFSCSQCTRSFYGNMGAHYNKSHPGMKPQVKDLNFVPGTGSKMLDTFFRCFPKDTVIRKKVLPSLGKGTKSQSVRQTRKEQSEEGTKRSTKEQEQFNAAIRHTRKTEDGRRWSELSCALYDWILPKEKFHHFKYYVTRHVSKHLGKEPFSCSTCGKVDIGWIYNHYRDNHRGIQTPPCDKHFESGIAVEMLDTLLQCFPQLKEFENKGDEEAKKDSMDIGTSGSRKTGTSSKFELTVGSCKRKIAEMASASNKEVGVNDSANMEPMSYDEKRQLSLDLKKIPEEKRLTIMKILKKRQELVIWANPGEMELDVEVLSPATLHELQAYAARFKSKSKENHKEVEPEKAPLSPSTSVPPSKRSKKGIEPN